MIPEPQLVPPPAGEPSLQEDLARILDEILELRCESL
jgi:hypothetical protein